MTATGLMMGTPAFMAPEQASRSVGPITPATDVWAVGTMLYELSERRAPLRRQRRRRHGGAQPPRGRGPAPARHGRPRRARGAGERGDARAARETRPSAGRPRATFAAALETAFGLDELRTTGVPIHRTAPRPPGAEAETVVEDAAGRRRRRRRPPSRPRRRAAALDPRGPRAPAPPPWPPPSCSPSEAVTARTRSQILPAAPAGWP